jgi:SET domain-containing protein
MKKTQQKHVRGRRRAPPAIAVRTSRIQGRGVFALEPIRRGARVIEYVGERIDDAESERRYDDGSMARHHTFLFQVKRDVVIDGARQGNDARFINHSCNPNCETIIEGDRVFIYARRAIATGDELTYDYWYQRDGTEDAADERLYRCACGTSRCRGSILAPPKQRRRKPGKARSTTSSS